MPKTSNAERTIQAQNLVQDAWLNLGDTAKLKIQNILDYKSWSSDDLLFDIETYEQNPGLFECEIMSRPEYIHLAAKVLLNITLLPYQIAIMRELWRRQFPMFIGSRGLGKSFLLAVYSVLRLILTPHNIDGSPRVKVVIVGAAFRQSKIVFEYMENIWRNADILRSICDNHSGVSKETDKWTMRINKNWAVAVPLGSGEKIRGLRATIIISDEFGCLGKGTLVETDKGLVRIEDINTQNKIVNRYGVYEDIATDNLCSLHTSLNITTTCGYSFTCSPNHKVLTFNDRGQKIWKEAHSLSTSDYLIHENHFKFPDDNKFWSCRQVVITPEYAEILGLLLSEGFVSDKYIFGIQMTDKSVVDKFDTFFSTLGYHTTQGIKSAYTDKRGWKCQKSYLSQLSNKELRDDLESLGLERVKSIDKKIPYTILQSSKEVVIAFLRGLYMGDGSCFLWNDRQVKNKLGIAYYSASKILIDELQVVLSKLNIKSNISIRESKISDNPQYILRTNGIYAHNLAELLQLEKWQDTIDCANRNYIPKHQNIVWDKSRNKWKVDVTIAGKRKYIGRYRLFESAQYALSKHSPPNHIKIANIQPVRTNMLYDLHTEDTHSYYANGFVQHNSIPPSIYETVVQGFATVSSTPVEKVQSYAERDVKQQMGVWTKFQEQYFQSQGSNQIVISGTAGYDFEHFADYWKKQKGIVESKNDPKKLIPWFDEENGVPDGFNSYDYSVIRVPFHLLPKGLLDDRVLTRAKATLHSGTYNMEFGCIFVADSEGFYKRSLIESCVAHEKNVAKQEWPSWCPTVFDAITRGNPRKEYVYGIDPASEVDNFSIVVLELHPAHQRVVYTWTTSRKDFRRRQKAGLTASTDFYGFCARRIRELMRIFPLASNHPLGAAIAIDAQGGGVSVMEALHDTDKLLDGEHPIWPYIDPHKPADTDDESGLHLLDMVQFASFDYTSQANHGLRKDLEDKVLLFPRFDPISLEIAAAKDKARVDDYREAHGKQLTLYDSLEDCVMEIEELKDELTSIVMTRTGTSAFGRDRWDTPEVKLPGGKKGRLRKDRYSSLLMANMLARQIQRTSGPIPYEVIGGFTKDIHQHKGCSGPLYNGPEWFTREMDGVCGAISRK